MRLPCERKKICKGTKLRGEKQEGEPYFYYDTVLAISPET